MGFAPTACPTAWADILCFPAKDIPHLFLKDRAVGVQRKDRIFRFSGKIGIQPLFCPFQNGKQLRFFGVHPDTGETAFVGSQV